MACKYFYTIPGQTKGQWYEEAQLEEVYNQMASKFDSGSVMGAVELSQPTEAVQKQLVFKATSPLIQSKASIYNQIAPNQVDATMKVIDALQKTPRKVYPSNSINGFYNDLIKLGTPKNQIELLKQHIAENGIKEINTNDLITSLLAEMSYTIEINTAKESTKNTEGYYAYEMGDSVSIEEIDGKFQVRKASGRLLEDKYNSKEDALNSWVELTDELERLTQHYSNLTVPGGTNYKELRFTTPLITPSIKGHAQFSTANGIGWFRSDDKHAFTGFLEDLIASGTIKKVPCG